MTASEQPASGHYGPTGGPDQPAALPADDVDRLYLRLTQLPAPHDFAANVMAAVQAVRPSPAQIYWALAELLATALLALLAFATGRALVGGGTVDLVRAIFADAGVLRVTPADALLALADAIPWIELLAVGLALACVAYCARGLGRSLAGPARAAAGGR